MKYKDLLNEDISHQFYSRLKLACKEASLPINVVGQVDRYRFLKIVINPEASPTLLITAGIHGDEPAGPFAIINWIENQVFPSDLRIIVIPLINPTGFNNNSRNNDSDRDLNRGFNKRTDPPIELELLEKSLNGESISLLLSLHEDRGHGGIYLYHAEVDEKYCEKILNTLSKIIPIVNNKTVYGDVCDNGLIYIGLKNKDPKHANSFENTIQALGVAQITFETPALSDFNLRVKTHVKMIDMVIDHFNELMG